MPSRKMGRVEIDEYSAAVKALTTRQRYIREDVHPSTLKAGDRVFAPFGVVTVDSVEIGETHYTIKAGEYAIKSHNSNWPELAVETAY